MSFQAPQSKQPDNVARMFDGVAPRYDLMNRLLSLGQDAYWRRATARALDVKPGERVLDLAAGTGTSSEPLIRSGAQVLAIDRSAGMVQIGRRRQPDVGFAVGDGAALPFVDQSFDAVTISFGLRNMADPKVVLAELARVTKPGGKVVICEFSTPVLPWLRALYRLWLLRVMPVIARLSANPDSYQYLAQSIIDWPPQSVVAQWLLRTGWHSVAYKNLTGGIVALHRGTR